MNTAKNYYGSALLFRIIFAALFTFPMFYIGLLSSAFFSYSGILITIVNFLFMFIPFGLYFLMAIPLRKHYESTYNISFNDVRLKFVMEIIGIIGVIALSYVLLGITLPIFVK